ncbi:acyl carrier protein, partial [Frankia sp. AgKG'84/4]|uniref:acyl carrier protein n=1 Tax=Frankia sp. AgKG'84/4 TaxID=573490 RepID=UPI002029D996
MRDTRQASGRRAHATGQAAPGQAWRSRLAATPAAARRDLLIDDIAARVSAVTGRAGRVDPRAPWRALGVYRDIAERLRVDLAARTGLALPATLLFDLPTPEALADHLHRALLPPAPSSPAA